MSTSRWTLVIATAALAYGCGGSNQQSPARSGDTLPSVSVEVQNDWHDRRVAFAQWDGARTVTLGEVQAGTTVTFTIPIRGRQIRFVSNEGPNRPRRVDPDRVTGFEVRPGDRFVVVTGANGRTQSARVTFN
ncbi:MAG: hypothetical protein OER90_11730 [Gemmatimonadota bacterium]|nr:hypothetical protein [Gemmatimonadota bacterium]